MKLLSFCDVFQQAPVRHSSYQENATVRKVTRMLNFNRLRQSDGNARAGVGTAAFGPLITSALLMLAVTLVGGSTRAQCTNPAYTPLSRCGTGDITIGGSGTCKKAYLDKNATIGTIKIASE